MYESYAAGSVHRQSVHILFISLTILLLVIVHIIHIDANPTRTITIINECSQDYWFKSTSGAAPTVTGSSTCNHDSDCIAGSQCLPIGICYWQHPSLSSDSYRIPGHGNRNT